MKGFSPLVPAHLPVGVCNTLLGVCEKFFSLGSPSPLPGRHDSSLCLGFRGIVCVVDDAIVSRGTRRTRATQANVSSGTDVGTASNGKGQLQPKRMIKCPDHANPLPTRRAAPRVYSAPQRNVSCYPLTSSRRNAQAVYLYGSSQCGLVSVIENKTREELCMRTPSIRI